jgi:N-acetylglucosaminyl-diphospho-decaprenol L-rhamnosyltransferase
VKSQNEINAQPDVSVVIPTHNTLKMVSECIDSILSNSDDLQLEIIVVDDASTDGTFEYLRTAYPNITVIYNPFSLGYGGAANRGMAMSTGRYIVVSNSDIKLQKNSLKKLVCFATDHPYCGVVAPKLLNRDGSLQRSISRHPSVIANFIRLVVPGKWLEHDYSLRSLQWVAKVFGWNLGRLAREIDVPIVVECVMGAFFLVNRDAYADTSGFDSKGFYLFAEESDWFLRIQQAGWAVYYFPGAEVVHYGSQTVGQFKYRYYIQQYVSFLRFYEKHSNTATVLTYKILISMVFAIRALYYWLASLFLQKSKLEMLRRCEMYLAIIKLFHNSRLRARNIIHEMQFRYIPTSKP